MWRDTTSAITTTKEIGHYCKIITNSAFIQIDHLAKNPCKLTKSSPKYVHFMQEPVNLSDYDSESEVEAVRKSGMSIIKQYLRQGSRL
jgi:hypothetical protein